MPATCRKTANSLILLEKMPTKKTWLKALFWLLLSGFSVTLVTLAGMYLYLSPNLPSVETLKQVKLQTPLRVYSRDNKLIGEFGEQRRTPLTFEQLPPLYIKALLAAEDAEFYDHHGVSLRGLLRAGSQLLQTGQIQSGGSTITMQLARDFFLTRKQVFSRKFNEILLSFQIERQLTKEEILELFSNKMFFGNRAYGLQAAAQIYYGKDASELSLAQYATIVGSLKAPSAYNPLANPQRALIRRDWIIGRMLKLKYIDQATHDAAISESILTSYHGLTLDLYAPYVAELARKEVFDRFGENTYNDGYRVYTSVDSEMQASAQTSVISGLLSYDQRHGYRGPEQRFEPSATDDFSDWREKLGDIPNFGGLEVAAITEVAEQAVKAITASGEIIELGWEQGLATARPYINEDSRGPAPTKAGDFLQYGDVIRIARDTEGAWRLSQVPAVQGTLVALNPQDGAILALVGGFDFRQSHFNRAVQGARQPGSSFKPFFYTAALENGFTPASVINDAPIVIEDTAIGASWRPENDDGKFSGPIRLRQALYRSRNLVSIRLLRSLGLDKALDSLERFGFDKTQFPRDLTLALGTHELTPLQMATGYATFANGGFKIEPHLVTRIEDASGEVVYEAQPMIVCKECEQAEAARQAAALLNVLPEEEPGYIPFEEALTNEILPQPIDTTRYAPRIIEERVAYIIDSMLKDVITLGTGRLARKLERSDIAGKTGTTNGPRDTWFAGYSPDVVAVSWVGFDQNTLLGRTEYGGSAALPIWIDFMRTALDGVEEKIPSQPNGIVTVRINRDTGARAQPEDPDAIFEIFRVEDAPQAGDSTSPNGEQSADEILPEELF
ncbi:peptidase [Cellvibrio sp. PSBB006]|nr:peptidase [Cellvibrio sp. PSBB006]